jgi:FG-GAP-like repeat
VRTSLRLVVQSCVILIAFLVFNSPNAFGQSVSPFFAPPTFSGNGQSISADVNGDGKPDLLFFDGTVLLGKGDGTFTTGSPWRPSATSPAFTVNQFAIADFNGDGKSDILVAGPLNVLGVMLGNGDGTFQAAVTTPIAQPASAFVVGDFNGDSKPDVLATIGSSVLVFLGQGNGMFAAGVASSALNPALASVGDFNGDGKLDLLITGSGVQLGNGDGTFQAVLPFPSGSLMTTTTVGDFDGDGKLDVFVTGGTSTNPEIQALFGNGDGTFRAATAQSVSVNTGISSPVAVDLNGDGKADIVGTTGSAAQVLISKGDGTFTPSAYYNAPAGQPGVSAPNMVVADFNGDKKNDVAAFNTMLLGNGDGTLQGNQAIPGSFGFNAIGDFNGDGLPDFASIGPVEGVQNPVPLAQANLYIWLNDGKNNFTLAHTYAIDLTSPDFADVLGYAGIGPAADLNGDGKVDLVGYVWDAGGLRMTVLLGNGDGSFGAPAMYPVNSAGDKLIDLSYTLGDLNGDGKPDFLINAGNAPGLFGPDVLYVLLNKGDGTFGPPITPSVSSPLGGIVVGDFNNDKKGDVVTGSANGLSILLGNGDGTFQPATVIASAACTNGCSNPVTGDFNGDGNLDLFVSTTNGYQVLPGKGDGTFNGSASVNTGAFAGFLVADFNGDGNPDVLGYFGTTTTSFGLILGNGDGTFGSVLPITNAGSPFVADFNGDKKPDILEVGSNQLVLLVNGSGPNFALTASAGSSATVAPGKTASYSLSLGGSGGFSGSVALTCSGAPAEATCEISPSSVTISGVTPQSATVSITTTAASQLLPSTFRDPVDPARRVVWTFGLLLVASISLALALVRTSRRRLAVVCCALMLVSTSLTGGCNGSGPSSGSGSGSGSGTGGPTGGTASGTYTITVTATSQSPAAAHKRTLTLIVQ